MLDLTRPDGSQPEDFHVTRRTATGLFFAGYALAAVSAEAAPITTPTEGLTIEEVLIPNGAPKPLPTYVARPAKPGRHPAILVASEIFGVHDYIKDICRRLARLGYVAVAPDFFYRSGVNLPALTDFAQIMPIVKQASDAQVDGDVAATIAWLKANPHVRADELGVTGFCWGGALTDRVALADPAGLAAAVAYYGPAPDPGEAGKLRVPLMLHYAGKDARVAATGEPWVAALKAAGKPVEAFTYPGVDHAFNNDTSAERYDKAAADLAWGRTIAFFHKHLDA